jgi:hypothetical protein
VDACPTLALKFMEESEAKDFINDAEVIKPERKAKDEPRVYYRNLPKRFIAGTVYDPVKKEVVIGAKVTLTEAGSGNLFNVETDDYGDFWFEKLNIGRFDLKIESDGKSKEFKAISTQKDVNLGDIPLT